jgi:hypothetical protein
VGESLSDSEVGRYVNFRKFLDCVLNILSPITVTIDGVLNGDSLY